MPKVSVVMPTFNNASYLAQAIGSVLSQSFKGFELLVINDGSADHTEEIVKKYLDKDQRVVYVKNAENKGLVYSLNVGLEQAKGEYIARLDGDDWWISGDKLSRQVDYLDAHLEVGLIGTFAALVNADGQKLYNLKFPTTSLGIKKRMLLQNCFVHSSVLFRKSSAVAAGLYAATEKYVEDYGLWLRIGRSAQFYNIPETMVGYRVHGSSETLKNNLVQTSNSLILVKQHKKYYPNYFFGYLKWSVKYLFIYLFGAKLLGRLKLLLNS